MVVSREVCVCGGGAFVRTADDICIGIDRTPPCWDEGAGGAGMNMPV